MSEEFKQMSRKDLRDYLRRNPTDDLAWEIFFQKIDESPKTKINSEEELIKLAKGELDRN